jgi:hypothetical protein
MAAAVASRGVIGAELSELNHRPSGAATEGEVMELEVDDLGMPIHPGSCREKTGKCDGFSGNLRNMLF